MEPEVKTGPVVAELEVAPDAKTEPEVTGEAGPCPRKGEVGEVGLAVPDSLVWVEVDCSVETGSLSRLSLSLLAFRRKAPIWSPGFKANTMPAWQ